MRRAIEVLPSGAWSADDVTAAVTLAFDDRHRRRLRLVDDAGAPFLLDLDRPQVLAEGDALLLVDGELIVVHAAFEPVADIAANDPATTARLAWHIGNRHAPLQVLADGRLRVRDDPVMTAMLEGLGARISRHCAPFTPEGGAYAGAHRHDAPATTDR
jgi:Urease accessory protein UreE